MKINLSATRATASVAITAAILATWCVSAVLLDQSLVTVQKSAHLMRFGAANGELFANHEEWRLLTSQFLHVHFPHMLFNAIGVFMIGLSIEKACGWRTLLAVYLIGGTLGQLASVVSYPDLISSGASQALMALCGAALVLKIPAQSRVIALCIVVVQVMLDLYAAGTIKTGHGAGFVAGLVVAIVLSAFIRRSNRTDA